MASVESQADVESIIAQAVTQLLALHEENDPSDERVAFLTEGLVKEYEARLGEWDDLVEAGAKPCGCESPIEPTVTVEPAPAPEPPKLEEEIGEGLWWAIDSRNGERCKVHVRRNALGDRWLMEGRIDHGDGTTHDFATPFDNEDEGMSGYFFLIRRVKKPTTRPYTLEELQDLVGTSVRGIREPKCVSLITAAATEVAGDGSEEPIAFLANMKPGEGKTAKACLKNVAHMDGRPFGVTSAGDPWDAPAMQRTNVGNSPAGD